MEGDCSLNKGWRMEWQRKYKLSHFKSYFKLLSWYLYFYYFWYLSLLSYVILSFLHVSFNEQPYGIDTDTAGIPIFQMRKPSSFKQPPQLEVIARRSWSQDSNPYHLTLFYFTPDHRLSWCLVFQHKCLGEWGCKYMSFGVRDSGCLLCGLEQVTYPVWADSLHFYKKWAFLIGLVSH